MNVEVENTVAYQEVCSIIENVQKAIVEHREILHKTEVYLEQNGWKQEYERYLESKLDEKKSNKVIPKEKKSEHETVKKVKRSKKR